MINYREILRLHSLGYSQRSIESSVRSSHQTVKFALDRAKELNISWPIDDDITNEMLDEMFVGNRKLEDACERVLAFSSSPSIRTITTLLKNRREQDKPAEESDNSNKYGITRGAAYWKKGGDGNA